MFRKVFIRISIIFTLFIFSFIFLIWKNEKRIVDTFVQQVNHSLVHPIEIESSNLGWLRTFPNLTLLAKNIHIPDKHNNAFLVADRLSIKLPLKSLFTSDVNVKSIEIKGAILDIVESKTLGANYNIFKKSGNERDRKLVFQKLKLQKLLLNYKDEHNGSNAKIQLRSSYNKVSIDGDIISFETHSDLLSHNLEIDDIDYLPNRNMDIRGNLSFNTQSNTIKCNDVEMKIETLPLLVNGAIGFESKKIDYDLLYRIEKVDIDELIKLVPNNYLTNFSSIPNGGKIIVNGEIKGTQSQTKNPHLYLNYQVSKSNFTYENLEFKKIYANGSLNNGKKNNQSTLAIHIDSLQGSLMGERISGHAHLSSLSPLLFSCAFNAKIPLDVINPFIQDSSISFIDGMLHFDQFRVENIKKQNIMGGINGKNIKVLYGQAECIIPNIEIMFKNDTSEIKNLQINVADQLADVSGYVINAPLTRNASRPTNFQLEIRSSHLNIDKIRSILFNTSDSNGHANGISNNKPYLNIKNIKGKIYHNFGELIYQDIPLKNCVGEIAMNGNNFLFSEKAALAEGNIETSGKLISSGLKRVDGTFSSKKVDIKTLFKLFNNFSQRFITAKNLSGKLDADVIYNFSWGKLNTIDPASIEAYGKLKILKGGLRNFDLLQSFSPYVDKSDLQHVKFEKLENYFAIKNEHIFLPDMQINSNAANLTLNGAHSFDNEMDYNLKIDAANVIGNKFGLRKRKTNKAGRFNLYYSIYGLPNDLTYDRNKRRVRKSFELTDKLRQDIIAKIQNH